MISTPNDFSRKLNHAQDMHRSGQFKQAKSLYKQLLKTGYEQKIVLQSLAQVYLHTKELAQAASCIQQLTVLEPNSIIWLDHMADVLGQLGKVKEAAACYEAYLKKNKNDANAWFNYAWRLRHASDYEASLKAYDIALSLNIGGAEEAYLNKAVIYSDHLRRETDAIDCLILALKINPNYTSALFNLANLKEEIGDKQGALQHFQRILTIDPNHFEALARLADVMIFEKVDDPVILKMKLAVKLSNIENSTRCNLLFALGKALNDCGSWNDAFHYYVEGNKINQQLLGSYDAKGHAKLIDSIISTFSTEWFHKVEPVSDFAPIFICGMFRSGSTLVEQILSGHTEVIAGGERDFFPRAVSSAFSPFPEEVREVSTSKFKYFADKYEKDLEKTFGNKKHITDKRPDNFIYLGLIKAIFPKARIIFTERDPKDNCLSAFFQRLGSHMLYGNNLKDLAHYYQQHTRLMNHWKSLFGKDIYTVNYDKIVTNPENTIRGLLDFLDLEWEPQCLKFYERKNYVKTASVWQVRQPLHQKSSGRWKHYKSHIAPLLEVFPK